MPPNAGARPIWHMEGFAVDAQKTVLHQGKSHMHFPPIPLICVQIWKQLLMICCTIRVDFANASAAPQPIFPSLTPSVQPQPSIALDWCCPCKPTRPRNVDIFCRTHRGVLRHGVLGAACRRAATLTPYTGCDVERFSLPVPVPAGSPHSPCLDTMSAPRALWLTQMGAADPR